MKNWLILITLLICPHSIVESMEDNNTCKKECTNYPNKETCDFTKKLEVVFSQSSLEEINNFSKEKNYNEIHFYTFLLTIFIDEKVMLCDLLKNKEKYYKIFENFIEAMGLEKLNTCFEIIRWYESEDANFLDIFVKYGLNLEEKKKRYIEEFEKRTEQEKIRLACPEHIEKYKSLKKYENMGPDNLIIAPEDVYLFLDRQEEQDKHILILSKKLTAIKKYQQKLVA